MPPNPRWTGSTNFNFVRHDRQMGFRHDSMLRQLLCVISASEATQDDAAIVEENSEIADSPAQSCVHAILQMIEIAFRSGFQRFREGVVGHGCSLLFPLRVNRCIATLILSDNAGGLSPERVGCFPGKVALGSAGANGLPSSSASS